MRLPAFLELIPEQLRVMECPVDQPLFVAGPPGSGKTVLAVRRAGAASDGDNAVALVTYNRMLRRLATLLSEEGPVHKTMHAFAWRDYEDRTGNRPHRSAFDTYEYDWSKMIASLQGHRNSTATWDHVVVDEGQDLPEGFFRYLNQHAAVVLTVFADEEQALRRRKTSLSEIRAAANLPDPMLLKENHRNRPEIAALAQHFHIGAMPATMTRRPRIGQRPRLMMSSEADTVEFIRTWFENRGGNVGIVVDRNEVGERIHSELSRRLPARRIDIYISGKYHEDTIALLDEGVTILNKESVKGQEFDTLFILQLERFIPCLTEEMSRAMYMMCARARDYLFLMHVPPLSSAAQAALPGPNILERG
jgi:superfamily I DNA/RNA helicase